MSEPLNERDRSDLNDLASGTGTLRRMSHLWPLRKMIARLDWCEAELAALAPLRDLLADVREDNDLRRAAEIGAARRQEIVRSLIQGALDITEGEEVFDPASRTTQAMMASVLKMLLAGIGALGPCLLPLPEEGELARLRAENAELREAYNNTAG